MRRGEIWLVDLEPIRGSEASKVRPAVVVSNDASNRAVEKLGRGMVSVVPLTSNTERVLPFQVLIPAGERTGLSVDSKAQAEQVRAVDAERLVVRRGRLTDELTADLDLALTIHLGLRA